MLKISTKNILINRNVKCKFYNGHLNYSINNLENINMSKHTS